MTIDYEAEYNNRARVPEHPAIFERWQQEAAAYRDALAADGRTELGLAYGPSPRQIVDVFLPPGGGHDAPLALFIHGGYWRSLEPATFSQMARGLNEHGIVVAVSGYDLVPQVSIGEIIAQTQGACLYLWRRYGRRIMASGHSAGGHLAACMVATDWTGLATDAPADLVPAGYSISGLFDLSALLRLSGNAEFKLDEDEARRVSPLFWPVKSGRTFDAVVGGAESSEFLRHSREIAEGWREKGVATRYAEIPGANHFTSCDPMSDPASGVTARLVELTRQTAAI